jgi:LruC domain-containing protein
MKQLLTLLLLSTSGFVQGQVTNTFENADRNFHHANCWILPGTAPNSQGAIEGALSARTGQLSSLTNFNGVVTPFVNLTPGNLTFKHRLLGTINNNPRFIDVVQAGPNDNYNTGGTVIWSYTYTNADNNVIRNVSIPLSVTGTYRYFIRAYGNGGSTRITIDEVSLPGTYAADPSNACLPLANNPDADGDGIADAEDAYPNDALRAFNSRLLAADFGTLMFEDNWPARGDYDFNDVVVDYNLNRVTNAANQVVEVIATFVLRATGAGYRNGFGFKFDGLASNRVVSATGSNLNLSSIHTLTPAGVEANQSEATFIVFGNAYGVLTHPGNSVGINTQLSAAFVQPVTLTISISFVNGQGQFVGQPVTMEEVSLATFNPFIIVNQQRGVEVHLPGKQPTALADVSLFNTKDDRSNLQNNQTYRTANNLPWAIQTPQSIPYPQEKEDILGGFLKLAEWAQSNGVIFANWYSDQAGYRNNNRLYIR